MRLACVLFAVCWMVTSLHPASSKMQISADCVGVAEVAGVSFELRSPITEWGRSKYKCWKGHVCTLEGVDVKVIMPGVLDGFGVKGLPGFSGMVIGKFGTGRYVYKGDEARIERIEVKKK